MNKQTRLYNIILPVWLLLWYPSFLWLAVIPLNWLIDWLVTRYSLKRLGDADYQARSMKLSWKICLAGFAADLAGVLLLTGALLLFSDMEGALGEIGYALGWNPFGNVFSLLIVLAAIALSALVIYLLDRRILAREDLTAEQVRKTALTLAVVTAPYLYLIPISLFNSGF